MSQSSKTGIHREDIHTHTYICTHTYKSIYLCRQWVSFWSVANESTVVLHQRNDSDDVNGKKNVHYCNHSIIW